ncbi:MAG TPA: hypothetical protein VFO69_07140 [Allosphingosinicella sp.]|nr:hypothetical protein [Allosphingosinicella sp.]
MIFSLVAAALIANTPSVPSQIEIASNASWDVYPRLVTEDIAVPNGEMVRRVQLMLQRDECEFAGQSSRRFDINVSYAVMLDPQGNATRIIVQDVGCRPLELYVGRIAADIMRNGYVRVSPPSQPSWYGNRINFNLQ